MSWPDCNLSPPFKKFLCQDTFTTKVSQLSNKHHMRNSWQNSNGIKKIISLNTKLVSFLYWLVLFPLDMLAKWLALYFLKYDMLIFPPIFFNKIYFPSC